MRLAVRATLRSFAVVGICILVNLSIASAQFLRVVTYNIDADTGGAHGSLGGDISGPGLTTVLQAIGNATLAGHAQPIDVLALQELNSVPSTTLQFIVNQLNGIYGAGKYAFDSTFDPTTGGTGGGPNGLVYNTTTVQLLSGDFAPKVIGVASSSGAPRAPMRYTLAPLGINDHSADFTIYVSHAKSGSAGSGPGSNGDRRNIEAKELRTDAFSLSADAHIIYSGDFNVTDHSEAAYQTMISSTLAGIGAVGQAVDTVNPANDWTASTNFRPLLTESATSLRFRDDFQFVTAPMLSGSGVQLVPGTYMPFGNNGSITYATTVNSGNNTALADLGMSPYTPAYRSSVLSALTTATDHLPIVADYSYPIVVPPVMVPGDYNGNGIVDAADYTVWQDTLGQVVTAGSGADGDGSGTIDQGDYDFWTLHFGETMPGSGAGAVSTAMVPEPNAAALLVIGGCLMGLSVGRLKGWTRRN